MDKRIDKIIQKVNEQEKHIQKIEKENELLKTAVGYIFLKNGIDKQYLLDNISQAEQIITELESDKTG